MIAADEGGSFTAAAETLNVTHGAISRRIAALEGWLGTSIFERHGRGVRLTPAGQRFSTHVRQTLAALSRSADQWRPRRGRPLVRLTVVPSFGKLWVLPRLRDLERGDVHIELLMEHRRTDLDAQEADLALRYGRGEWEGLNCRTLFEETLVPVACPALAAELDCARGEEALLSMPLLHDSDFSQWRDWLAPLGTRYRPRWQDRRFEDYDMVLEAAVAGLGIALLRRPTADSYLRDGRLMLVSERALPNPAAHHVCMRSGEQRGPVIALAERLLHAVGKGEAEAGRSGTDL